MGTGAIVLLSIVVILFYCLMGVFMAILYGDPNDFGETEFAILLLWPLVVLISVPVSLCKLFLSKLPKRKITVSETYKGHTLEEWIEARKEVEEDLSGDTTD